MQKDLANPSKHYNRNLLLILLSIVTLLVFSIYIDIKYKKDAIEKELISLEKSIISEHKKRLKESVYNTVNYIDSLYRVFLKQDGKNSNLDQLSDEKYKQFENEVRTYLYNSVYDKVRYTWINKVINFDGGKDYALRLIHPNLKHTEGELLSTNTKDIKGNYPYLEEVEGIKSNGQIFYTYYFKEFDSNKITRKISFAQLYKKLDWIIATGIPTNVLDEKINKEKEFLIKEFNKNQTITLSIKGLVLFILGLSFYLFRNQTNNYIFENLSKSNEVLNNTNEKLSLATKTANIGIWKWNIEDNSFDWDELMYKLYEIDSACVKITYDLWLNTLHKEDRDVVENDLKFSIMKKKKFLSTFRVNTNTGIKFIQAFGETKYSSTGKPLYVIGINFDITKEKNQEKMILKQAETFSSYVNFSRTDEDGIITDVSDLFCKTSGYTREEIIGQPHNIVRHEDTPKELFKELWANLKAGKSWTGEIKNKNKDGSYYWSLSTVSLEYDNNGDFIGYISIRTDITYKKDLELKQIQLMEQSKLASLGEMIGNIAHQWRQPLSVISTAATGIKLQQELGTLDSKLLEDELEMINDNAQHLSQTINTFRDFIKEDKESTEVVLQERIKDTFKILNASLNNNHIKIINKVDDTEPIKVKLILGELAQVIMNIINNSKDALLANKIENPTIIIDIIRKKNKVVLTIEDNAGGIKEDILPHVFEPYFTTKHKSQGTGLGLYMSFNIVKDSLKGNIYIENTKIGAKTFIELPIENND